MIKFIYFRLILFFSICIAAPVHASEQLVVVVNINNPISSLTKSEVIDIFMGKYLAYPNGELASPFELSDEHKLKELFYLHLIGRSIASVNSYWARLKFTGRKRHASIHLSEQEIIEQVSREKWAIAYVSSANVTKDVKVVYKLYE